MKFNVFSLVRSISSAQDTVKLILRPANWVVDDTDAKLNVANTILLTLSGETGCMGNCELIGWYAIKPKQPL